jgi:hypothetical protein
MAKRNRNRANAGEKVTVEAAYEPSDSERADLGVILGMPGYTVLERIALGVVAQTKQLLMRANPLDNDYEKTVVELHRRAQVAEGVWEEIRRKIETQKTILGQPRDPQTRPDMTEGAFEIGGPGSFEATEREVEKMLGKL